MANSSVVQSSQESESLRDARRSFTRARICAAAREVFYEHGFGAATLEQVAHAAGTRRTTLYNYFRDKEELLTAIAEDYLAGLIELIDQLPSPLPSRTEIEAWVQQVAAFTVREQIPTMLFMHFGSMAEVPPAIGALADRVMAALAVRLLAFKQAMEPGPEQSLAQARALAVLQQLAWACLHQVRHKDTRLSQDMLTVAAELLERFIRENAGNTRQVFQRQHREFGR